MLNATKETTVVSYTEAAIKTMHIEKSENELCFRAHWHDRIEFLRITNGELYLECGTANIVAKAGDLVIIPPKISHKGYTKSKYVSYNVLMFDLRSFYNDTEICKKLLPDFFDGIAKFKQLTNNYNTIKIFDEIYGLKDKNTIKTTATIYLFLHALFENELLYFEKSKLNNSFAEIISYIEENYEKDITITSLSQKFGYSSAHFSRKFKNFTGLSPIAYLNIFRLEKAYQMINESSLTISEISAKCGFTDANYFTRCFKKHFGMPPTLYKNKKK